MNPFIKHMFDLFESIDDCLEKKRILPCLTLLYSGIDVVASLEARRGDSIQKVFVEWVGNYLTKESLLNCDAIDLYAARCGIVHTFTSCSKLASDGKARRIYYAWGSAEAADLQMASKILDKNDVVAIHVRDLIEAFRKAVAKYLDELEANPQRGQQVESALANWFIDCDPSHVKNLIALDSRKPRH